MDEAVRPASEPAPQAETPAHADRVERHPTVPPPSPGHVEPHPTVPPPPALPGPPHAAPLGTAVPRRRRSAVALVAVLVVVGAGLSWSAIELLAGWEPPGRVASLSDGEVPTGKATVGGVEAAPGQHPAVVAVGSADVDDPFLGQECGGTVVAARWVLTAAHCTEEAPDRLVVHAGSVDLTSPELTTIAVAEVIVHPRYDPFDPGLEADLALLWLAEDVAVPAVRLAGSPRWRSAGAEARILGWGGLAHDERRQVYPEVLIELPVPTIDDATCAAELGRAHRPGAHFCAGDPAPDGGADACRGDSGGPLLVEDPGGWVQIGIVSFGETCGRTYTAYTDVAAYCGFVTDVIAPARGPCVP